MGPFIVSNNSLKFFLISFLFFSFIIIGIICIYSFYGTNGWMNIFWFKIVETVMIIFIGTFANEQREHLLFY